METTPVVKPAVRDLAATIYADLVGQALVLSEQSVKLSTSAENLAMLSFKLAVVFQQVEDQLNADSLPKNQDFQVDVASIAKWSK